MIKELNKSTIDKTELPIKVLQFGTGNFLRAFVDWMIEKSNQAGVTQHGIAIVQSTTRNTTIKEKLEKQDGLYHVYLEGSKNKQPIKEITLVKSVMSVVNANEEYDKYRQLFLSEDLELIISNTTEAGIRYLEGDDIYAEPPVSFPAKITALLYQRFKKFEGNPNKGLHLLCTELIENNGSTLKEYVLQHALYFKLETAFISWVDTACYFYDTLVDRIVPGFPKEDIDEIQQEIGFNDELVVKGEYFHVWAIGGNPQVQKILPLDKAGLNVLFMEDVSSFRDKKVRVLNGAHTAMVPVALQLGCETVGDAFSVPEVEQYIHQMVDLEVLPVIQGDPDELKQFANKILERFYNPYLKHYLKDISLNSLSKWETRDYPTVLDNYSTKGQIAKRSIFSLAALLVLYSGKQTINFTPVDTPEYVQFIRESFDEDDINKWIYDIIHHPSMWRADLSAVPFLEQEVVKGVKSILQRGMRDTLKGLIQ